MDFPLALGLTAGVAAVLCAAIGAYVSTEKNARRWRAFS
jgi:hypothetical protein